MIKVLPKNSMLNLVLKSGHGIVARNAMCAKKSEKASFSFVILFPVFSSGIRMLSKRESKTSLKMSWCSISVLITKAIGA